MDAQASDNPLRAIGLKVLSVVVFMAMVTCIKVVAINVPTGEIVFFRSFFAIPVIAAWLWSRHELRKGLSTANPMAHVWRGLLGCAAMGLNFAALGLLPLPEVTAIGYARPLLVTVFAAMFLGEAIRAYRLTAVLAGLIGVLVILAPRLSVLGGDAATHQVAVGAILALISASVAALAACLVRRLVGSESTTAIVFYFSVTCSIAGLATIPFGWVMPTFWQTVLLVSAGLLGGLGQILVTASYRYADIAVIAPFDYLSMLLALAIGWFVFFEPATTMVLIGAALVTVAGLFVIYRERRLGLERSRARKVMTPQG